MKKLLKNSRGFSLAQVMVALALAGGLSVVIMKQLEMQTKANKKVQLDSNVADIKRLIQQFVTNPELCFNSFNGATRGKDILFLSTTSALDDKFFAKVDEEFQKTGMIIKAMKLLSIKDEIEKFKNYMPLSPTGVSTIYLRIYLKKKAVEGKEQRFFGGTDTYFDIPITAKFVTPVFGFGNDRADAITGAGGWNTAFTDKSNELIGELTTQGITQAYWASMNLPGTLDTQIKLIPKNGVAPTTTNETTIPHYSAGSYAWIWWGVSHPLLPIGDCGSHLTGL